jgi:hypothetical protein
MAEPTVINTLSALKTPADNSVWKYDRKAIYIARVCLAEAHNDSNRAIALAGKYACGVKLRQVHVIIGDAFRSQQAPK